MKSSKFTSGWFMWFVGFIHGQLYIGYFIPHGYYWQWVIFLIVTYVIAYQIWRFFSPIWWEAND